MHVQAPPPLCGRLVVDADVRLWQERDEAVLDPELPHRSTRILGPAAAPGVELRPRRPQFPHVTDHLRHRNPLRPEGPNERVIDIDIDHELRHQWMGSYNCLPAR